MTNYRIPGFSRLTWSGMARLLAVFCLVCSWAAEATAPRIAPGLFGEERKADIVGYRFEPLASAGQSDGDVAVEIVKEAFSAAGKTPALDVLPSKQLAKYELLNNDVVGLIASRQDMSAKERKPYSSVTFYLRGGASGEEPVSLFFSKKNARGNELHKAFNEGLQKILKNGKYLEILEKYYGKGRAPADYAGRLKRHNPGWK